MNILDPQGPIAAADKTILIDSIAIMLAIVVPTIIAIFAFAFWFRQSNPRAHYLPDWDYSGRIEMVVWSIPALTIILLGGVAWIGVAPARSGQAGATGPASPFRSRSSRSIGNGSSSIRISGLPPSIRLTVPAGAPLHFELTSGSVMNAFFIPQLGSMIYTMNGMVTRLELRADEEGTYQGLSVAFQRRRLS